MIVQSVPEGQEGGPRFVITLQEHLDLVGQLSRAFGNDQFETGVPKDEFLYVVRWHDKGWVETDENPPLDPRTRLPYNLVETPFSMLVEIGPKSPDYNERHHPYCGLIDSMHIWGLYHGRYGLSDKMILDFVPAEDRPKVDAMLEHEFDRQERLKAELATDPNTTSWVQKDNLFRNYKLLQFFDTLALYFNCTHDAARTETTFENVPLDVHNDTSITIRRVDANVYSLDPNPFAEDGFEAYFEGRLMRPFPADEDPDMAEVMRTTPVERQDFRIGAG